MKINLLLTSVILTLLLGTLTPVIAPSNYYVRSFADNGMINWINDGFKEFNLSNYQANSNKFSAYVFNKTFDWDGMGVLQSTGMLTKEVVEQHWFFGDIRKNVTRPVAITLKVVNNGNFMCWSFSSSQVSCGGEGMLEITGEYPVILEMVRFDIFDSDLDGNPDMANMTGGHLTWNDVVSVSGMNVNFFKYI